MKNYDITNHAVIPYLPYRDLILGSNRLNNFLPIKNIHAAKNCGLYLVNQEIYQILYSTDDFIDYDRTFYSTLNNKQFFDLPIYNTNWQLILDNISNEFVGIISKNDSRKLSWIGYENQFNPIYEKGVLVENKRFDFVQVSLRLGLSELLY